MEINIATKKIWKKKIYTIVLIFQILQNLPKLKEAWIAFVVEFSGTSAMFISSGSRWAILCPRILSILKFE